MGEGVGVLGDFGAAVEKCSEIADRVLEQSLVKCSMNKFDGHLSSTGTFNYKLFF